ncbi:hypothetical protein ANCCAN_04030 [Ancylostoma caninum]|uniref:Uncharacterized protein n=1 Tax=Ancylostoma caninum TaxID=29170 RepID=A0A368H1Z5_ANCCA|nr:hypothetical protein ANCCAN_04030 [Ancylostoma caninum]
MMMKECWGGRERAMCYCNKDYCNGDFDAILKKWVTSSVSNKTLFNCVKQHIEQKTKLTNHGFTIPSTPPPKKTTLLLTPFAPTEAVKRSTSVTGRSSRSPTTMQRTTGKIITRTTLKVVQTTTAKSLPGHGAMEMTQRGELL